MLNIVVVSYNQKFNKENFLTKINCFTLKYMVYLCDNSTDSKIKQYNKKICTNNINYVDMNGNKGLSKAYNKAIELINHGWVLLLDQDSNLSDNFFSEFLKFKDSSYNVLVPTVKTSNSIISPMYIKGHRVISNNYKNHVTAINSGMFIKRDVFDIVGKYDETYFLDYIDHYFCRKLYNNNIEVKVLDTILFQNFFEETCSDINSAKIRFCIFKKDFKVFCNDSFFGKVYYKIKIMKRATKLNLKFKTLKFYFWR